ncbi:sensor domain-containing diguanylate cyclase [Burkholderia glumae]|nr:Diguanylate cyclase [Burkholderia glumae BGR1]KHJ63312.1 diguanylate cyclase [Burkholderia glumae]PJO22648.1 sensor domain-containing diguanylate cyclase [Burkholderia glumae AU6208]PNL06115.1 sensor domain-containing diguanylate cyclase [Burkholderia glumae]QHE12994.1 diguanylate cyclase [Burkholderia glumae AU6208]
MNESTAGRRGWRDPPPRMPLGYLVIAAGVAIALVMMTICAAILRDSRVDAFERAQDSARNTLLMIERDVARSLHIDDLALQGVIAGLRDPSLDGLPAALRRRLLFDRAAVANDIGGIYVLDAEGRLVLSSTDLDTGDERFDDRDFFAAQRDDPDTGLFVSSPYTSVLTGDDPSIALSRRLNGPDGRFAGVVVLAVRLHYFRRLFAGLTLGPHGSIALIHANGRLIMRAPSDATLIGRDLRGTGPYTRMLAGGSGSFVDVASIDGVRRSYLFQRLPRLPVIVQVAVAEQDVYAEWRRRAWRFGILTGAFGIAFVVLSACLAHSLWRQSEAEAALARLAGTDSLTGLPNRRSLDASLEREWRRAVRSRRPLAILFVDIDHFKRYNDEYGHTVGDEVLACVSASIARQALRSHDVVARYGGEEFVVVLPDTDSAGARAIGERIRDAVRELAIAHAGSESGYVTVSVGVATWRPEAGFAADVAVVVDAADQALYRAKEGGRDRVFEAELA